MNRKKLEIALNAVIAALAAVLAILYGADGQGVLAALFALIAALNLVGVFLRHRRP